MLAIKPGVDEAGLAVVVDRGINVDAARL